MSAKKIIKIRDDLDLEYMKDEFILLRETEIGKHTLISIKSTLNGFLKEYPDLPEQKLKLAVMKFLSGKSNEYFNKQLQALRSFFQYLVSEGHLIKDYTEGLKFKSHTVKIVQHSEETIRKFMDIPDRSTYAGLRDYTVIQTMLDSGLRPNEAIQLKINDIDFQNKYINVRASISKMDKFRTVPISDICINSILKLIKNHHHSWTDGVLFCSYRGDFMTTDNLRDRFRVHSKILGVSVTPYDLRHTFAIWFLRNGGNVFALQKIMGHTKLDMTRIYLNLVEADMQNAHKSASPLSNLIAPKGNNQKRVKKL